MEMWGLILILLVILVILVILKMFAVDRRKNLSIEENGGLDAFNKLNRQFDDYHDAGNMKKAREIFKKLKRSYRRLSEEEKVNVSMDWDFGKAGKEIINRSKR